jgi:hypothetical protein
MMSASSRALNDTVSLWRHRQVTGAWACRGEDRRIGERHGDAHPPPLRRPSFPG